MAEKVQAHFSSSAVPTVACTAKQSKKDKTELEQATNKNKLDSSRGETRVNIGLTVQQWRQLMGGFDLVGRNVLLNCIM